LIRGSSLLLMALLCAGAARPQTQRYFLPVEGAASDAIQMAIRAVSTSARPGGHGFIRIELHNPGTQARVVDVSVSESWSPTFSARQSAELDPEERVRLVLPIRHVDYQARVTARADGGRWVTIGVPITEPSGDGISVGVVAAPGLDVPGVEAVLDRIMRTMPSSGSMSGTPNRVANLLELRPDELPPTWDGLSGFDLVVVDARRGGLDGFGQSVLRDYIRVGGRILVLGTEALGGGPLADSLSGQPLASGFGSALGLSANEAEGFPGDPGAVTRITPWLTSEDGPLARGARPVSGPLPPEIYQPIAIPGVGDVPYRAYLAVLLLFGVLVGPVNYMVLQRRRKLGFMLLTVPALGLVTTAILLSYGLLRDGLGLHSAARSLTILDQERHDAVSWEGRTVFAGLPPASLKPRPKTSFDVTAVLQSQGHSQGIMLTFEGGVVDGGAVPPRTPVTFGVASSAVERARLRFERLEAGGFEVLASDGLQPVPGPRRIVLRTAEDAYWIQGADGRMESASTFEAEGVVRGLLAGFDGRAMPLDPTFGGAAFPLGNTFGTGGAAQGLRRAAGGDRVPVGCYLAVVLRPGPLDDLGLLGEDAGYHLVLGRLGREDIVD
jgi:hypothetical protein